MYIRDFNLPRFKYFSFLGLIVFICGLLMSLGLGMLTEYTKISIFIYLVISLVIYSPIFSFTYELNKYRDRIADYSFERYYTHYKQATSLDITKEDFDDIVSCWKEYLYLHIKNLNMRCPILQKNIPMISIYVDELWHILCEDDEYEEVCMYLVGRKIYHIPHESGRKERVNPIWVYTISNFQEDIGLSNRIFGIDRLLTEKLKIRSNKKTRFSLMDLFGIRGRGKSINSSKQVDIDNFVFDEILDILKPSTDTSNSTKSSCSSSSHNTHKSSCSSSSGCSSTSSSCSSSSNCSSSSCGSSS